MSTRNPPVAPDEAPSVAIDAPVSIALSLVSHTNAGKTTLARTLLGRDVGVVRDEAHVTDSSDAFPLLQTTHGDRLMLWDTPGFGDSNRLARRLTTSGNPIGWVLTEVWDRFRDRPFWSSQQAIRHVRDSADVVLYLANAAEDPADAGYVAAEMRILEWIGKPVIVLLNQLGTPREPALEAAERARWAAHLSAHGAVHEVLALDAFARCWVQETTLLAAIARTLPERAQAGFNRLTQAWRARHTAVFESSMGVLARRLASAALDTAPLSRTGTGTGTGTGIGSGIGSGIGQRLRAVGARVGIGPSRDDSASGIAMRALAARLDANTRASTNTLIELHGLRGQAADAVLARLADQFKVTRRVDEGRAALLGGLITGSLAGLKADLLSGGLTLGGGLIAGGLIGALGAAGLAHGYNRLKNAGDDSLAWADETLDALTCASLLGYLTVAHFGRGRGDWDSPAAPGHWAPVVRASVQLRSAEFERIWRMRDGAPADIRARTELESLMSAALQAAFEAAAQEALIRLYPDSPPA